MRNLLIGGVVAATFLATPAAADPTAMQPLASESVGNYAYDIKIGEGLSFTGQQEFCIDIVTDRVVDADPPLGGPACSPFSSTFRPKKKDLSGLTFVFTGNRETGEELSIGTWVSHLSIQRLKITVDGRRKAILPKATNSEVRTIFGQRARYWFAASTTDEDSITGTTLGQRKECRKRNGKRRCSWRTIAVDL